MNHGRLIAVLVLGIAAAGVWRLGTTTPSAAQEVPRTKVAQAEPQEPVLSGFMRMKLEASGSVLEGLAVEDFEMIQAGARQLKTMSEAEKWRVSNDALYRQFSAEFRRISERLEAEAKKGNLDGAALAWMDATMSCIDCHRWVRNQIVTGAPAN